ncbi:BQ5605_C013g07103 [Microbotryum silenes-dioicae]|uniref:BQ5605_C013g07103 protein n=1 Tax=Microbotryum silenes-dioicae TaxID=796604 RepID=A0A2X0NNB9_9BASI|nr:BQ5605_C013g07103 [Microbotryum silenes-dioicae]
MNASRMRRTPIIRGPQGVFRSPCSGQSTSSQAPLILRSTFDSARTKHRLTSCILNTNEGGKVEYPLPVGNELRLGRVIWKPSRAVPLLTGDEFDLLPVLEVNRAPGRQIRH